MRNAKTEEDLMDSHWTALQPYGYTPPRWPVNQLASTSANLTVSWGLDPARQKYRERRWVRNEQGTVRPLG
jgi:hypothetical protein